MALTTFSDLVQEARERVKRDALAAGLPDDGKPLRDGGTGATAYADAVGVYLAFAIEQDWRYGISTCALGNQVERDMRNTASDDKRYRWSGTMQRPIPLLTATGNLSIAAVWLSDVLEA